MVTVITFICGLAIGFILGLWVMSADDENDI